MRSVEAGSAGAASGKTAALSSGACRAAPEGAARARTATRARVCRFRFFSKPERLTQPEVQGKSPRSGQKIDGHDLFARLRIRIKTSVRRLFDALRSRRASRKCAALIELRVAEWVLRGS